MQYLRKMMVGTSTFDVADSRLTDAIISSNFTMKSGGICTDSHNLCVGQFGSRHLTPTFGEHISHVVGLSAKEQMVGSHTEGGVTDMTDTYPTGDGSAVSEFPRETVGICLTSANRQGSIGSDAPTGPYQTVFGFVDLCQESLYSDRVEHSRRLPSQGCGQTGADGDSSASVVILASAVV